MDVLLRGAGKIDNSKRPPNPDPKLFTESSWDMAFFLESNFAKYGGLCHDLKAKLGFWRDYSKANDPYEKPLLPQWEAEEKGMDSFDKLLIIRI
jgi:hypothetical protein